MGVKSNNKLQLGHENVRKEGGFVLASKMSRGDCRRGLKTYGDFRFGCGGGYTSTKMCGGVEVE